MTRIRGQGRNYSRLSCRGLARPCGHAITALVLALALAAPSLAQDKAQTRKKPTVRQVAHKKASPEQVRKFNELAKKRQETK